MTLKATRHVFITALNGTQCLTIPLSRLLQFAAIQQLGLPNAVDVAHFIGEHRQVADELVMLQQRKQPRRVVRKIQEISHQLAMGQLGQDQMPYRQWQKGRQAQVRGRR